MNPSYLSSIHHDGAARYIQQHGSLELHVGDEVILRLRNAPDAPIERILLRICPDSEQFFTEIYPASSRMRSELWRIKVTQNVWVLLHCL
jgi:hypothetical protein